MKVSDVLATKGSAVVTIEPAATVTELLALLAQHKIGAVVVGTDGGRPAGIISERDIARALHAHGADALTKAVSEFMTAEVRTCAPGDEIHIVAGVMTDGRFRHLPVLDDDRLVGVVSIGDIVKNRIDELETQTDHLMDYIASP